MKAIAQDLWLLAFAQTASERTIEALRIAEKFAPEEDGLWIYGAEFWSTLAA